MKIKEDRKVAKEIPYYQQVRNDICTKIENGYYKRGQYLPCEQKLCQEYHVSRTTIRSAVSELIQDGYLFIVRGKGTRVSYSKLTDNNPQLLSFTDILKSHGYQSQMIERKTEIIKADRRLAGKTGVDKGDELVYIYRIRGVDDEPVSINKSYLPKKIFEGQDIGLLTAGDSMYENLRKYFRIVICEVREEIWAVSADSRYAEILDVDMHTPLLAFERESFDKEGNLIEYSEVVYRSDRYKHAVMMRRNN